MLGGKKFVDGSLIFFQEWVVNKERNEFLVLKINLIQLIRIDGSPVENQFDFVYSIAIVTKILSIKHSQPKTNFPLGLNEVGLINTIAHFLQGYRLM